MKNMITSFIIFERKLNKKNKKIKNIGIMIG